MVKHSLQNSLIALCKVVADLHGIHAFVHFLDIYLFEGGVNFLQLGVSDLKEWLEKLIEEFEVVLPKLAHPMLSIDSLNIREVFFEKLEMLCELLVDLQSNFRQRGSWVIPIVLRDDARIAQVLLILHAKMIPLHLWVDTAHIELFSEAVHVGVHHLRVEPFELVTLWLILVVLKFCRVKLVASPKLIFGLLAVRSARWALRVGSWLGFDFMNLMLMMCSDMGFKRWYFRWRIHTWWLGEKWCQSLLLLIHCKNVCHQIWVAEDRQDIWLGCLNRFRLWYLVCCSCTLLELVIIGSHVWWKIFYRIEITVILGQRLFFSDVFLRWARSNLCECRILCHHIISCSFFPLSKGNIVQL